MGLDSDRLVKLAKSLEDDEAEKFVEWIVEMFENCDAGLGELQDRILKILDGG